MFIHACCNDAGQENRDSGITPADQMGSRQQAAAEQQYHLHRKSAAVVASHDAFAGDFAGYAVQMADHRMTGRPVAPQVWRADRLLTSSITCLCSNVCQASIPCVPFASHLLQHHQLLVHISNLHLSGPAFAVYSSCPHQADMAMLACQDSCWQSKCA